MTEAIRENPSYGLRQEDFSGIFTLASERELGYIYKKEMQKNKYSESIGGIHKCWKSITRRISLEKKIIRPE